MGNATVEELDVDAARAELTQIEANVGLDREVLEQLEEAGALNADQYQALRRLRALEWLLR